MTTDLFPALIETAQLQEKLGEPNLRLIDATYYVPPAPRDAQADYRERHLPGAVFFDIDRIADTSTDLPHMLPSPADFEQAVGALGISNDDFVVIYDMHGIMSAPRLWWTFRVFGHDRVSVLNGGFPKWEREGRAIDRGEVHPKPAVFKARPRPEMVKNLEQVRENLSSHAVPMLDMRPAGRFAGRDPEPRAGLRGGHIPGSRNIAWAELIDPEHKTFLPLDAVQARFEAAGINPAEAVICSCGSGVTACMGALGLYLLGNDRTSVYDGSWAEWGSRADLPVEADQTTGTGAS